MRKAVTPATKAIMLCTPNNPTGPALQHAEVIDFLDSIPDHILITLDEAYLEFVTDPEGLRGLDVLTGRRNVAVLLFQGVRAGRVSGRLLRGRC
jgi:histidinol-phosphate aminotransferase